jgi:cytochrome c
MNARSNIRLTEKMAEKGVFFACALSLRQAIKMQVGRFSEDIFRNFMYFLEKLDGEFHMISIKKLAVAATMALAVAFTAGVATDSAYAASGKKVFGKCKACHGFKKNKVGPNLAGIVGRKAGSVDGFKYSKAMKKAAADGLVWTEENIDAFVKKPKKFMKKTKMAFAGLKKESQRKAVIEFLKDK